MKKPIPGASALPILALLAATTASHAATLTLDAIQRYDTARPSGNTANLSTSGTTDWAVWSSRSSVGANVVPTTSLSGGTAIGNLTPVLGTNLQGSGSATSTGRYTWTNGTPTVTFTDSPLNSGLIFNSLAVTPGSRTGAGFSVDIQGIPGVPNYLVLYLGGFVATGKLTLTLAGATTVIDQSQVFISSTPKQTAAYQVIFTPDNATDKITVSYVASVADETSANNSHVGIEAISLGLTPVIPEPASAALGALGSLALLLLRRRR